MEKEGEGAKGGERGGGRGVGKRERNMGVLAVGEKGWGGRRLSERGRRRVPERRERWRERGEEGGRGRWEH